MEFIDAQLDKYVCDHSQKESMVLAELNRKTHLNVMQPRMLSGHFQGRVLSMFSKMIQPEYILEIGTYTGYSALCLAEGLKKGGKLITIDNNEELHDMVENYISKAGYDDCVEALVGDAQQVIAGLNHEFDIVFIDADKKNYINYYNLVFEKVRPGGLIIADNVLWSGKVLMDYEKLDADTKVLVDYNQMIHNDKRVEAVLLPIRDGLMIARKI